MEDQTLTPQEEQPAAVPKKPKVLTPRGVAKAMRRRAAQLNALVDKAKAYDLEVSFEIDENAHIRMSEIIFTEKF